MSMLGRAAAKFEKAFVALPDSTKQAVALAIYRAAPAMQQYQKDIQSLTEDAAIVDASWDVMIAAAFRLIKGRNAFGAVQLAELQERAPETADFFVQVGRMVAGFIPGAPAQLALPPRKSPGLEQRDDDEPAFAPGIGDD